MSNRKAVKPKKTREAVEDFTPIVLEPEDTSDVETFHAFTIGEVDYYGATRISFDEAKALSKQLSTANSEGRGLDADKLICTAVYGPEGWAALDGFEGLQREHYKALVEKATDIVLASMGKA